jgi:Glycosyltransferase 61
MSEHWIELKFQMSHDISELPQIKQAYEIGAPARAGEPLSLIDVLSIKRLLRQALPQDAAFDAYRGALNLGPAVRLERRRIGGLLEAAQAEAREFHILHQGGECIVCKPPEIIGPCIAPQIEGVTRTVFVACFENAVAYSRSGAIQLGSELCFDIEGEELDSLPVDMAFDPLVFGRDGHEVDAIIDKRATTTIKVDRAWSLMGVNSVSFGHWILEGLLQFVGVLKKLKLEGVPILIDEQMPPQHRESLELLGRGRFPIIEVPRWLRVEARQLWRASNWFYSPHLLLTDQGLDLKHCVMPMSEAGDLYRFAASILDEDLAVGGHEKQTFIARPGTRHRRIANFSEIEAFLESRGFSLFFPEQYPFGEQMRAVRQSRNIVIQSGSAALSLLLARPGTKACYLTHPAFLSAALFSELMKHVDVEMKIVSGPFEAKTEPYLDRSDYRIPLDWLKQTLEEWMDLAPIR